MLSSSQRDRKYRGTRQSLGHICREEGWRGMYKGNGTNSIRVFPYTAAQFLIVERMKLARVNEAGSRSLTAVENLLAGAVAGTTSVCLTYPLDFVRARLAVQQGVTTTCYNGIWHALKTIVHTDGLMGIYRGLTPTLVGIAPYVGLNFMVFEGLKARAPIGTYVVRESNTFIKPI